MFGCFLSASFWSCHGYNRNAYAKNISDADIRAGAKLARVYCQSCHGLPDPALADAKTWETGILPAMGPRLGIFYYQFQKYPIDQFDRYLPKGYYPPQPLLSVMEWEQILDYYKATSPDSLPAQQRSIPIQKGKAPFRAVWPLSSGPTPAATTYVHIDTNSAPRLIAVADALTKTVSWYDAGLHLKDSLKARGGIVDMDNVNGQWVACNIGVMTPNNGKFGNVFPIKRDAAGSMIRDSLMIDSLERPVQMVAADLDKDGLTDYLVCEFGNAIGALSWFRNMGNGHFERRILRAVPGAIKAIVDDYNHDGLPDIWCLFAQGDEGIFLFTNRGNGHFDQQEIMHFPAINGSTDFELDDFNKDGYPDILYTCGDNADYSMILKPYHGVYIFMNDGKNHFTQQYFYPLNGCFKAMARDFDGDGDLDLATISFFADYNRQPEEGFVYFENKGNLSFEPSGLPETEKGRWLTMDAADIDGDGKTDIVLGNFSVTPSFIKVHTDWKKGPAFMVLKNVH